MKKPIFAHCLFEQSGTFKRAFQDVGIPAEDYDIKNNFGQTDNVIDLFREIEQGWNGEPSIFDKIKPDEISIAFFPCIMFNQNNALFFTGKSRTYNKRTQREIAEFILQRNEERAKFYGLLLKLCMMYQERGLQLIVENPAKEPHYLTNNFPFTPALIDNDRTQRGDLYAKPTKYYFINRQPTYGNTIVRRIQKRMRIDHQRGHSGSGCSEEKSMITDEYAHNFICDFIIGKDKPSVTQLTIF